MKFSLWTNYGARNSVPVFRAFADSLLAAGHEVVYNQTGADRDVIWSVLWKGRMQPNKFIFKPQHTIVLEVGGISRGETWKVGIGGINREAYFGPTGNTDDRVQQLGLELTPWSLNENGDIIICCQNPFSRQWQGYPPITGWVDNTINELRKYTDRRIVVRPHPRAKLQGLRNLPNTIIKEPVQIPETYDDFDFNTTGAWAVVNLSSNPATQAAINGIPVFVDENSLAYDVGNTDFSKIENPAMPDRQQWLNDIAYTEWTVDEIEAGLPLQRLTERLE